MLKKTEKALPLEFLGMCRTGKDIRVEYQNGDELKRLRQAYITHVVDYVCQDRDRVFGNDKIDYEERHKGRVTLDNVFDIAEQQEEEGEESEADSNISDDEEGEDEEDERAEEEDDEKLIQQNDMLKSAQTEDTAKSLGNNCKD